MTLVGKAQNLVYRRFEFVSVDEPSETREDARSNEANTQAMRRKCALVCVENEYHEKRELLFNLKSCGIDMPERVYLLRLQGLIDEEKELKEEINKL